MSLLRLLGLPKPKNFIPAHAASPTSARTAPQPAASPTPAGPANGAPKHEGAACEDEQLRSEAKKAQAFIEAKRRQARDELVQMQKLAPLLDAKVAASSGDEKKKLMAKQAELEKRTTQAVKTIDQAEADLEAIDSPGTGREALLAIMARRGSSAKVSEEIEVSSPGLDPYKKSLVNHDRTTTTTALDNGKATVETVHDKQHVGAGGYTKEHAHETEVTTAGSTARNSEEKKTNVSLGGKVSVEKSKKAEIELADGRKSSVEHKTSKEVSSKGASLSDTVTTTNLDGSATAKTRTGGVERGEGKVTTSAGTNVTTTSASGTAHVTDKHASGGMVAGKDGLGAQAGVDGGKTVTSKGGMQAGVVAGLHANVVCNVGKPTGNPPRYPVTVAVSFGASVGVTAGDGKKEGSKGSASVEVKASEERSMTVTHILSEAELADYTKALKAASTKGGKVAGTQRELAIISAGVNQGWDAAKKMWSGGGALSKQSVDSLTHAGDSIERKEVSTRGAGANVSVGPVGVGGSVTDQHTRATKVTRGDGGALDVEGSGSDSRQTDKSASLYGVGAAHTHLHETRFGYSIEIDPKNDSDGKLVEWLGRCKSEQDYMIFVSVNQPAGKIKVISHTSGKSDADTTGITAGKGNAGAGMSWHSGVDEDTTVDGSGKLIKKRVAGHSGHGGNIGPIADSADDDAVAEIDGDGNASLTLTETVNDNHNARARGKLEKKLKEKLPGGRKASEEKPASGLLTKAAGGEEEDDNATHDVSGITLTTKDLKRLGKAACASMLYWMEAPRSPSEIADWKEAGIAIVKARGAPGVVAEQLARFIGGDAGRRRETVEHFVRGGYRPPTMGHAFEFPDSLHDVMDDYNLVTDDGMADKMNAFANHQGDAAAAEECKRLVAMADRINTRINACNDFDNAQVKMEMLQRLMLARNMLFKGIKGFGGDLKANEDPKILQQEGERLIRICVQYTVEQMKMIGELNQQDAGTVVEKIEGRKMTKRLEDLQYNWKSDYMRLQQNYAKRKLPANTIPVQPPDPKIVDAYDKKFDR